MIPADPSPDYQARLRDILEREDWQALRDFAILQNQIPDEVSTQDQHFWQVLLHKLVCNRPDLLVKHQRSRVWLDENGYTSDIGGY